jgi:4-amino-4-deoxy-L-arabinose transferase-like glycosyltransferase
LIGSLDILVVYFIAKRFIHSRSGLIAALIMIAMPLHLYYSRTETVVIFSSLITSLLLLSLLFFVEKNSKNRLFAAVIMIGFALNFHGSAKAAAGISGIVVGMIVLYRYLNRGGLVKAIPGINR